MMKKGFTLIELLIVVAIIAILAAIAVPNFLEAQVRSKVSRAKAEIRTLKTALESYRVDNNKYPTGRNCTDLAVAGSPEGSAKYRLKLITTPIAYLTSIPDDPFQTPMIGFNEPCDEPSFIYLLKQYHTTPVNPNWYLGAVVGPGNIPLPPRYSTDPLWVYWPRGYNPEYLLASKGPWRHATTGISAIPYDSTNGTISFGEIAGFGP